MNWKYGVFGLESNCFGSGSDGSDIGLKSCIYVSECFISMFYKNALNEFVLKTNKVSDEIFLNNCLDLSSSQLSEIQLEQPYPNVISLNLMDNCLQSDEFVMYFPNLQRLNIKNNRMKQLLNVQFLKNLKYLIVDDDLVSQFARKGVCVNGSVV